MQVLNPNDELGRLSTTLNQTFDRLHAAIEEMRRFTSDASHELRTPVTVLYTQSEVLLRHPRTNQEYRNGIENTLLETKRLGKIVDQLLTLSRHDAGILDTNLEEVPVDAVVKDVVESLETTALQKHVRLEIGLLTEFQTHGHDVWLSQLFYNLVDNAIKFTSPGGSVRIFGTIESQWGKVVIEDTGIGISSEHIPHLFERFYRVDSSREHYRGTGLGLSIVKSIVEAHHGMIDIESHPKKGSRFIVSLPLASLPIESNERT